MYWAAPMPGGGAAQPFPAGKSGAVLPAGHLHPLPSAGSQCARRSRCAGGAGAGQGGQLSGVFPQLRLFAAGARSLFAARWPDIPTLVQQRSLDDAGRAEFLAQFAPHPANTLLGFAVMGGIFGEGRPCGRPAHRLRHRGGGSAAGEPPAGDAAPVLRSPAAASTTPTATRA